MNKDSLYNYAKYSSIGFQMMIIILVGVFGGLKLDSWLNTSPIFTIILSLLSIFLAMYYMLKDLIKVGNKNLKK
jgi:F0F1-type ATP synthase assembly protein I